MRLQLRQYYLNRMKKISGEFTFKSGKLNFVTHTDGLSFNELKNAIIALRDECQRQLNDEEICPFYIKNVKNTLEKWILDVSDELFDRGRRHDLDKEEIVEFENMYQDGLSVYDAVTKFLEYDN